MAKRLPIADADFVTEYNDNGKTLREIAEKFSMSKQGVRRRLRASGVLLRSHADGLRGRSRPASYKEGSEMRVMLSIYRYAARKRNLEWSLSEKQFSDLTQAPCHYCGIEKYSVCKQNLRNDGSGIFYYNGVDRQDKTQGYTVNNCVTACKICNAAKTDLTIEKFNGWLDRLVKFRSVHENVLQVA